MALAELDNGIELKSISAPKFEVVHMLFRSL